MPGYLAGPVGPIIDTLRGKAIFSRSTLAKIGGGEIFAALGGCIYASMAACAQGTITFTVNPSSGDTVTLNGTAWTFETSGATGAQTNIKATLALTLAQLVTDLLASADSQVVKMVYGQNGTQLLVTAVTPGTAGNSLTLAASVATATATLAGGAVVGANGADTTEDTLGSFTLPMNTFDAVGRNLEILAWGNVTATSATKTAKLYFGSSMSQSLVWTTTQTGAWQISMNVWKSATNVQQGFVQFDQLGVTTTRSITSLVGAEADNASITVKVTGKSSAATAGLINLDGLVAYAYN